MKPTLNAAADGYLMLELHDCEPSLARALSSYLTDVAGFSRVGQRTVVLDEGIHPSFSRGELLIEAGWNNWSGEYLAAKSAEGNALLHDLFGAIGPNNKFNPEALKRAG